MKGKIDSISRILLFVCAVLVLFVLFLPIWRIELDAPQYPEGLELLIYANGVKGDVDIINGLNHYIGMATIHSEDFIEFTVLPYIIVCFAILFLGGTLIGRKVVCYGLLSIFFIFGVVAMIDFYIWLYEYGHNLDPKAAIIIPGMSYQPPLIGFKQLLNFGAYSMPAIGGILFILCGLLLVVVSWREFKRSKA